MLKRPAPPKPPAAKRWAVVALQNSFENGTEVDESIGAAKNRDSELAAAQQERLHTAAVIMRHPLPDDLRREWVSVTRCDTLLLPQEKKKQR